MRGSASAVSYLLASTWGYSSLPAGLRHCTVLLEVGVIVEEVSPNFKSGIFPSTRRRSEIHPDSHSHLYVQLNESDEHAFHSLFRQPVATVLTR